MQDLYGEREQLFDQLMQELEALRRTGQQYAENEAEYRKALRIAILEERSKGTPVTVISDLCRGRPDIAREEAAARLRRSALQGLKRGDHGNQVEDQDR